MKKIKVLAKNSGYFNSVLPEKYALGDWIDLKAGKTTYIKVVRNQPEIEVVEVEDLTDNDRNGFGSSGVR